ncbi:MAG: alpha/beta fold hydrolase [Deltaproteobacteria bacterium]|nr:alpha/beta fold hydrolase [Deltaproteobacteria bacterium]
MAPFLAEHGFDGWVLELRGHGLSPKGPRFAAITAEDHMRLDLAAAQRHVDAATGRPTFWVGHSAGGLYTLGALSAGWLDARRVAGVATFGSQIRDGERFLRVPGVTSVLAAALRVTGHFPAPRLGLGPEVEPAGEMIEFLRWKGWRGRWASSTGFDYRRGLGAVDVPLIAFAGAADQADPPGGCRALLDASGGGDKTFVTLGRNGGYTRDYGHVDMVVSKEAAAEVWPVLARWLEAHRSRSA